MSKKHIKFIGALTLAAALVPAVFAQTAVTVNESAIPVAPAHPADEVSIPAPQLDIQATVHADAEVQHETFEIKPDTGATEVGMTIEAVPEPGTAGLFTLGVVAALGLWAARTRLARGDR